MSVLSKTQYKAQYGLTGSIFPDNNTEEISEGDMRQFGEDTADSFNSVLESNTVESWKSPCAVATTGNITLSGEQTIDGVLTSASRVLVKNQTTQSQNGIYVSAAGAWSRSTDADDAAELEGAAVGVTQGTTQQNTVWLQTSDNVTLGSTAIAWQQIGFGFSSGGVSGLSTDKIPKAASATSLVDSIITESSSKIGVSTSSPDRKFHVEEDSATTNAVTYVQRLTSTSSGTPANGIGVGMEFEVETSAANNEVGATIEAVTTDVTGGSEDFDLLVKQMQAGAAAIETLRITPTAASNLITLTLGGGAGGTDRRIMPGGTGSDANIDIRPKGGGTASIQTSGSIISVQTNQISISGNTNVVVNGITFNAVGISNNSAGLKHARVSTSSISAGASALVTVTWGTAFSSTNYTVTASVADSTSATASLAVVHVESISTTQVQVRVSNTSAGSITGTLHVIAIHD